jgi:putative transposase
MNQKFKEPYENKIHDPDTFKINILAYCVMPNHFHLLIRQRTNGGVVRFMSDVINSITRYFNTLTLRKGPIFLTQFRSKHIYSNDQLQYISRYIHLNPLAANLTRSFEETSLYRFSSLREYVSQSSDICSNQFLLKEFKNDLNNFVNYLKEEIVLSEEDDFTSEV